MTRQQHAALIWAQDNLTGQAQHDFVAAVLNIEEVAKANDQRILNNYPMLNN